MPISVPQLDSCSFCDNFAGIDPWHGPPAVVHDADGLYVILAPAPAGGMPGHTLVIPRRHAELVFDLTHDEETALWAMVGRVAKGVRDAFDPDGLQILQNNGVGGFQSVPHVHVHVIPFRLGHTWPPAEPAPILPSDVRAKQAQTLRRALRCPSASSVSSSARATRSPT